MVLKLLMTQLNHVDEHICKGGILLHLPKTLLPKKSPTPVSTRGIRLRGHLKEAWGTASSRHLRCKRFTTGWVSKQGQYLLCVANFPPRWLMEYNGLE